MAKQTKKSKSLILAFFAGVVVGMYLAPPRSFRMSIGDNNVNKLEKAGKYHWDESMGDNEAQKVG